MKLVQVDVVGFQSLQAFLYRARVRLRGTTLSRPCFLMDAQRLILPAYGTYTGGLFSHDAALCALMGPEAQAILTGPRPMAMPMPRAGRASA